MHFVTDVVAVVPARPPWLVRCTASFMALLKSCAFAALTLSCAVNETESNWPPSQAPVAWQASVRPEEPLEAPTQALPRSYTVTEEQGVVRPLEVPGFQPALLFTPTGDSPRPLVIAAHGAGGGPEWECEYWRRLTRGRAFILSLTGTPLGKNYAGYFFRDHHALNRELIAAEQAARAHAPRILAGSGIYTGFSQGATMGTPILAQHANAFPYGVFIEGFMSWNVPGVRQFIRAGGQRVLIACGSKECATAGKTSIRWFEAAGAEARLEYAPGAGHTPGGPVMEKIEAALPWLLGEDPNWR